MDCKIVTRIFILSIFLIIPSAHASENSLEMTYVETNTDIKDLIWEKRPMLVFSNSHLDPNLKEQIKMFVSDPNALSSRDVRVFIDDKPEPNSKLRKRFRPKGFLIILIGKDGQIKLRKNSP
ncbi:MAG: DUF4174 domain-containing protein, partial [Paracoccaceae bacterium]|nr:DUF4174 domain-containing protein [Paracoccaceae bacterium]